MTPEQIHDALNLLPSDLITAADKLRQNPRKAPPLRLRGWVATAACAALVLMMGSFAMQNLLPDMAKTTESIAEAPAAAAPEAPNTPAPMDIPGEMQQEAAAMDTITLTPTGEPETEKAVPEEAPAGDHRHAFDESPVTDNSTAATGSAYCGNTKTTVHIGGETFDLWGSDSIAITRILDNLEYDPNAVCRCIASITIDTELIPGIEVNLGEGFARCDLGQANLTEEQAETIRNILNRLGEVTEAEPAPAAEQTSIDLTGVQYIATPVRPDSSLNLEGDPRTSLVTSSGALYDYYVKYCELFYMDDYFAATVPYNRAWFLENDLLILRIGAPHPEFHYDVTGFWQHQDTDPPAWQITLKRNPSEPTDIAFDNNSMWHILIPLPKGILPEEATILIDFE